MQKKKDMPWRVVRWAVPVMIFLLVAGITAGIATFAARNNPDAAQEPFARIYIVSRAGGISAADVFWQAMQRSVRIAILWLCACASPILLTLGAVSLLLEGFTLGYTAAALTGADGFRGVMLSACILLPQNLLLWIVYAAMGLFTVRYCMAMRRSCPEQEVKRLRGKYALLMLACIAACVPLCMLHMVFTLKLMKLLPFAA